VGGEGSNEGWSRGGENVGNSIQLLGSSQQLLLSRTTVKNKTLTSGVEVKTKTLTPGSQDQDL